MAINYCNICEGFTNFDWDDQCMECRSFYGAKKNSPEDMSIPQNRIREGLPLEDKDIPRKLS